MANVDNTPNRIEPYPNIVVTCTDNFKLIFKASYIPLDAFMWECASVAYKLYYENKLEMIAPVKAKIFIYLHEDYSYRGTCEIDVKVKDTHFGYGERWSMEEYHGSYGGFNTKLFLENLFNRLQGSIIYNSIDNKLNPPKVKPVKFDWSNYLLFARLIIIAGILFIVLAVIAAYFSFKTW